MAQVSYSFLDIAVLQDVRGRFAKGDALVVLSTDLDEVIWANGPGAALFGHSGIMAAMGAPSKLGIAPKRQIAATGGFPAIGRDRAIVLRMTAGLGSRAVPFLASEITLPDGEAAILLVAAAAAGGGRSDAEIAGRAIGGFGEAGHFAAFVDRHGAIEASSSGFLELGMDSPTLASLASGLAEGHIAKRMLQGAKGQLPTGIARLTDNRLLVVVVDEDLAAAETPLTGIRETAASEKPQGGKTTEATSRSEKEQVAPAGGQPSGPGREPSESSGDTDPPRGAAREVPTAARPGDRTGTEARHDSWYFSGDEDPAGQAAAPSSPRRETEVASRAGEPGTGGPGGTAAHPTDGGATLDPAARAEPAAEAEARPDARSDPPEGAAAEAASMPGIDRTAAPLRFVWRTDAEGRFSQISPEFSAAVGDAAADVIGRRFRDVAEALGLDPTGEIAGLLARRDTWSGRSVLWPVAGTNLRIPVDLAALPVYDRGRNFEGFRGFGVARAGDAVADPQAPGTAIAAGGAAAGQPSGQEPASAGPAPDRSHGEVAAGPQPESRHGDKVIRLAEHRQPANGKGLSSGERTAFQQIAERLRKESGIESGGPSGDIVPPQEPAADAGPGGRAEDADGAADYRPAGETGEARAGGGTEIVSPGRGDRAAAESTAAGRAASTEPGPGEAGEDDSPAPASAGTAPISGAADSPPAASAGRPAAAPRRGRDGGVKAAPGKPARSGLSLLDFARWDGDRPHEKGRAESGGAAEPPPEAEAPAGAPAPASGQGTEPTPRLRAPEPRRIPMQGEAAALPEPAGDDSVGGRRAAPDETPPGPHGADPSAGTTTAVRPAEAASERRPHLGEAATPSGGRAARPASTPAAQTDTKLPGQSEGQAAAAPRPAMPPQERRPSDASILEKLPVPVLVHSGDALHYANAEFLSLTGYASVAELAEAGGIGALFVDPFDGEDQRALGDRQLLLRDRRGEEFLARAFLQSVPWSGGKALLLVLERSHGEPGADRSPLIEELEAHVAEMRTIIDTATDGVVLISRDGTIRSISRPAEALFGFDSDEVAGKPFASLFAIESQRAARDYLAGLSDHGVASVLNDGREVIGREAEGRFIPLFMTIGRLPADSGYCAVVRDITQWKRAEEDLTKARATAERASAYKTEFLARISHEIRTPLNAIIGFSELMMDEKFGPVANDRYRDYLRDINRSGNHVLDLVNDLLDISKIEAGQQDMAHEAVSLNEVLAETVAMMQPQANRERVIIRSSLASKLPDVVADLRSVRQIALNLLSNAVRYTQAGGQVIVSTSYEPAGEVVMRVRDTGIGMTQAEIEQALKPFKQLTSLKRARGDGTGLGLPLTKAMVEANRAKFAIHSTPGEGTLVEISFPSTRVLAQ